MIAVFLIGAAALLLLHGFLYENNWFRSLTVRVLFSRPHMYANEVLELTEIIENRKRLALPIVEIGFRVPRGLHFEDAENTLESDFIYKRDLFAVQGMERIVRRYHVTAQRRGFYSVTQLTCHAPSRLFHRTYMMDRGTQEEESGLYVYAANVDCSMLLRAVDVILGERESSHRLYEDPFVFASIRPYTIQDPMKSINWKATAKTGELMVNTYASTAAIRVRIFLDVSADPGVPFSDSFRELGIAVAASLIRALVRAQKDAALVVNCMPPAPHSAGKTGTLHAGGTAASPHAGGTAGTLHSGRPDASERVFAPNAGGETSPCVHFSSCQSAERLTAVEEFLAADFDSASLLPFEEMLRQESGQRAPGKGDAGDEVYVFLTYADRPSLRTGIQKLLGIQRRGILAVLCRTIDHRHEEQQRNLHILPIHS